MANTKSTTISTTSLALMTAAAVISLRGLPMMAKEELTMFFYIGFATILYLIPASLVAAELGSAFGNRSGGVYTWVKEAYGAKFGFLAIWLQWIQNVVWYPTVLAFAAAAIAYTIGKPELANNGTFVGIFSIAIYWLATLLALKGTDLISKVTSYGFVVGTVIPGVVIILIAIVYILQGNTIEFLHPANAEGTIVKVVDGHVHPRIFPHISGMGDIAFLAGILLLFAGVEVHAVHAQELPNPQKDFPKSILLAGIIIFALFTFGSLAVATILPYDQIDLQAGLMQAFQTIFAKYHIPWMTSVIGILVAFGVLAGVSSWIAGPSRGLLSTAKEGVLPPFWAKTNKAGIQQNILLVQGTIVTILSGLYFVMDNVSVAFFLLSALTIGLYLIMYLEMYAAAIKLRYTQPDLPRSYKVPGGNSGMWFFAGIGFLATLFSFVVAFFPPTQLPVGSPASYVAMVAGGTVIFVVLPFIISRKPHSNLL
ncbi:putative glutamate/gamma-aminobutyrate antiporter [Chitinophaga skermanii]|uniref:Putative glutamate/gamma-aminobutyrate antiporter n=1 Tax=Chitinophaga skermanii TaxID=331697 RepID=A0A327R4I3_9BACT|nr:APC family permease [Chitinophaga skermanii]RAJ10968.1 putative glutamate/gamma-aminobutyrate antiporter [Chitinophaga skermanii]